QHVAQQDFLPVDDEKLGHTLRQTINELIYQTFRAHPYDEPDFAQVTLDALTQLGFPRLDNPAATTIFEALRIRKARELFPDALTTLAMLQKRGFILGVVTNRFWGGPPFVEDMYEIGLLDYFDPDCMAISADLGIRKPNPAIFMHALNALRIAPAETAMVGDSLSADIAGANQLNIFPIWKPSPRMIAEVKAALPPDQAYLNDKHLIPYARRRSMEQGRPLPETAKPGLIIEQLSDLLDIFLEAGVQ
ncbi:MAG: HAD-IA family hydrolase, partial [Ktedonobacteraceae bacterium]|nr:HAD-IA family hydrolase [Ktedonobacteraceae bacterium]